MKVPYLDLPRQFGDPAFIKAVQRQFEQCQFILGEEVAQFEAALARLCQTRFALGLNSGTDAIFLALKALNIGPGDEVITVPNSFIATAGAIFAAGATATFVDVGADYNMDPALLEAAITPRTRAIMPVHLTGNPADMPAIVQIAAKGKLAVIEDAAQAVGADIDGKPVGSFGDAGAFSLHPLKNLNVAGDGGALTTNSPEIHERVRLLRNHGLRNRDEIEFFGFNSRLDSIQAAVANCVMKSLGSVVEARRRNAALYDSLLSGLGEFVTIPPRRPGFNQVFHTYIVTVRDRARLIAFLAQRGVETKIHYAVPIHLQKPCRAMGHREGEFPVAERQAGMIISLPIHQHLGESQIRYVCGQVADFYRKGRT